LMVVVVLLVLSCSCATTEDTVLSNSDIPPMVNTIDNVRTNNNNDSNAIEPVLDFKFFNNYHFFIHTKVFCGTLGICICIMLK